MRSRPTRTQAANSPRLSMTVAEPKYDLRATEAAPEHLMTIAPQTVDNWPVDALVCDDVHVPCSAIGKITSARRAWAAKPRAA